MVVTPLLRGGSWGVEPRTAPGFTGQRSGVTTILLLTAGPLAELAPAHRPVCFVAGTIRLDKSKD